MKLIGIHKWTDDQIKEWLNTPGGVTKMEWKKAAYGGWISGKWHIRPITMLTKMFWIYFDGDRYTPTGRYDDCVHFFSLKEAKTFCEKRGARK